MLIPLSESNIVGLTRLWSEVFGDGNEYISLLFEDKDFDFECFGEKKGEEIISALYLLPCGIRRGGELYRGRYLYAAATLTEHRGEGLMSRLIGEVKLYCKEKGLDFIALVPAEESLYGYYERFGFFTCMYKYMSDLTGVSAKTQTFARSEKSLYALREAYEGDMLLFDRSTSAYAERTLRYSGFGLYESHDGSYLLADEDFKLIYEYIPRGEAVPVGSNLFTPTPLPFGKSEKLPFGMLCPINERLSEAEDIYMNIALD